MSKAIAASAMVLGGAGTAVTGVYVMGAFEKNGGSKEQQEPNINATLSETLDNFDKNINEGCIPDIFPELNTSNKDTITIGSTLEVKDGLFSSNKQDKNEGCLVVNWSKKESSTSGSDPKKWKGDFRLLWASREEEGKGFIVFAVAKTVATNKQLNWDGVAYSLEFDSSSKKWNLSKKKKVTNKTIAQNDLDDKFPKAVTGIYDKSFFGFIDQKTDLDNLCDSSDCTPEKDVGSFQGYWEWKGKSDDSDQLGGWTDKLSAWWGDVFTATEWDMSKVVENMKGKWVKRLPK